MDRISANYADCRYEYVKIVSLLSFSIIICTAPRRRRPYGRAKTARKAAAASQPAKRIHTPHTYLPYDLNFKLN